MSLYVDDGHRFSGAATALMEVALGGGSAHLWVFEKNSQAQAFYARQGFASYGHRKVDRDTGLWELRLVRR